MIDAAQFAAQVAKLAPDLVPDERLALAVSGGADSLALMALAASAFGARAHVLSVNHGLRPEAAGECALVARLAGESGLPVEILGITIEGAGNLQARARQLRYQAMAERCRALGIRYLLTAHHADDQAETMLMRLARGSGLAGLSAIRPATAITGITVLRPLLERRRAELQAITANAGWQPVHDPSNHSPHYDRTRARQLLQEVDWLAPERLATSARNLQRAEEALTWATERAWAGRVVSDGKGGLWIDSEGLPQELSHRLLRRAMRQFGSEANGPALQRLQQQLFDGQTATLAGVCWRPRGCRWHGSMAPPRQTRK